MDGTHKPRLRVAVTGARGYIGGRVVRRLLRDPDIEEVLALDILPWKGSVDDRCIPLRMDIQDPRVGGILQDHQIDGMIHLAFILHPTHDEQAMRHVNVNGTRHLLDTCRKAGVQNIVVASSGVVYGAKPEHTEPITENHRLDLENEFSYAAHKIEVEGLCADFRRQYPGISIKMIRPCVVIGPGVSNYLSRSLQKRVVFAGQGHDPHMQFIHEEDMATVFYVAIKSKSSGVYNACGDGTIRFSQLAGYFGRRVTPLPITLLRLFTAVCWYARLSRVTEFPPQMLPYVLYPWVMSNERIKDALGVRFQYSTRQAVQSYIEMHPEINPLPESQFAQNGNTV